MNISASVARFPTVQREILTEKIVGKKRGQLRPGFFHTVCNKSEIRSWRSRRKVKAMSQKMDIQPEVAIKPLSFPKTMTVSTNLEEMKQAILNLQTLDHSTSFLERIENLKGVFNYLSFQEPMDRAALKVVISEEPYFSRGIFEKFLPKSDKHFHIRVFEMGNLTTPTEPILHMRFGKENGELIWISARQNIPGPELIKLAVALRDYYRVPLYVYDDAKKQLPKSGLIFIKFSAVGDLEGKTWYQKALPDLAVASGEWTLTCGTKINQNDYPASLNEISHLKICDLWKFYQHYLCKDSFLKLVTTSFSVDFESWDSLNKRKLKKEDYLEQCQKTLQELQRTTTSQAAKIKSYSKVLLMQECLFTPQLESNIKKMNKKLVGENLAAAERYWNLIRIISDTRIFVWNPL